MSPQFCPGENSLSLVGILFFDARRCFGAIVICAIANPHGENPDTARTADDSECDVPNRRRKLKSKVKAGGYEHDSSQKPEMGDFFVYRLR
jgi:hypothetical protein